MVWPLLTENIVVHVHQSDNLPMNEEDWWRISFSPGRGEREKQFEQHVQKWPSKVTFSFVFFSIRVTVWLKCDQFISKNSQFARS